MALGRNQIKKAIDQYITDALNNQITPAIVRLILKMFVDNFYNKNDDTVGGETFPADYVARAGFGNLKANTNLAGKTSIEALVIATTPEFQAATISISGGGPIEKGKDTEVTISGNISLNDEPAADIGGRSVEKGGAPWQAPGANSFNYQDTIKSQTTYAYKAISATRGALVANTTIAAFAPSYHGSTALNGIPENIAESGAKQIWGPQASRAITFTNNNSKPFFVEPKTNGKRNRIMDQNGFNVTAAFTVLEDTFTLADGETTEAMYIYIKTEPAGNGSAFVYTFFNS